MESLKLMERMGSLILLKLLGSVGRLKLSLPEESVVWVDLEVSGKNFWITERFPGTTQRLRKNRNCILKNSNDNS
jgi:hypothetical protein